MLKKDPLKYGLEIHGLNYCNCYDNNSKIWIVDDKGIYSKSINYFPTK